MGSLVDVVSAHHRRVIRVLDDVAPRFGVARLHAVRGAIDVHARAEQELVYRVPGYEHEEHGLLRHLSARLCLEGVARETRLARLSLLRALFVHHAEREERVTIPALERELGRSRARQLALRFRKHVELDV